MNQCVGYSAVNSLKKRVHHYKREDMATIRKIRKQTYKTQKSPLTGGFLKWVLMGFFWAGFNFFMSTLLQIKSLSNQ